MALSTPDSPAATSISTADQVRTCREWADQNDVEVLERYVFFDEKQTGRGGRRAQFKAMMRAVAAGELDVIIVFTTSRLFRKTYRSLQFVEEEIVDRGLRAVFVKSGPIDTDDPENWRKLLHLHSLVDELQVSMQAAHIKAAHEGQLRIGVVFGTLTYGYTGEPVEGQRTKQGLPARKLVVDPETGKWVKQIFLWFTSDDLSIAEIVRRLNAAGAPLPDRVQVGRWTYLVVRRILDNPRYRGFWQYGATEAVWQNKKDYSRQFKREQPLAVIDLPYLRLVDEGSWHAAQRRLADYHGRAGRKPKNSASAAYPKLLNRLCFCKKHDRVTLSVGGKNGGSMFCRVCRGDPERALVSLLPRVLGTKLMCLRIAELIRCDAGLAERVVTSCRRQAGLLQRPDPGELQEKRRSEQRLTQQIGFVMSAPGETEVDMAENHAKLAELRRERAAVLAEIQKLQEAAGKQIKVPTAEEARALLDSLADVLVSAAGSGDERKLAAARRIIESVTGGRIVISQQGEAKAKRGWLRATFKPRLLAPALGNLGVNGSDVQGDEVHVDVREPAPAEALANEAKALWDEGLLVREIAAELTRRRGTRIGRAMVNRALAHWFGSRGLPLPDGRSRRKTLNRKSVDPNLAARIAGHVMALVEQGVLYAEVAQRLGVKRDTVTAAVRQWHESRGLPVPDGRTRRKGLDRKSRESAGERPHTA